MRNGSRIAALAAAIGLAAPAALAEKACFFSYASFEEKIPHADLDLCPGHEVKPEEAFCRIALQGEDVYVYMFRHAEPGPCLTHVDRYRLNEFVARFGPLYDKP
jgi:hypothetical protein